MSDFRIADHGSVCTLMPLSDSAHAWVDDHLPSDALTWAGGVVVEPRFLPDIVAGIEADGLEFE